MRDFVFDLDRKSPKSPAISVICINKNHSELIESNILSVLSQNYEDFEFIIADGGSEDSSLEVINRYKFIRLVSGKDSSRIEGLNRALQAAHGRYVMVTTSTDGYLSREWFKNAASLLDNDSRISLVFGASANMNEDGVLGTITFPTLFPFYKVPMKEKWSDMWLMRGLAKSYLPELNYCVRMDIFKKLMGPSIEFPELNEIDPILRFHFEFNRLGYLPNYMPILANFGRTHNNQEQHSERNQSYIRIYDKAWKKYRKGVIFGSYLHGIRDAKGKVIAQSFIHALLMRICLVLDMFFIQLFITNTVHYAKCLLKKCIGFR